MNFNNWLGVVHDSTDTHVYICCGDSNIPRKSLFIGSRGYPELKVTGTHDLYAEIQSYKDTCDLESMLKTFDLSSIGGLTFDELGDLDDFTNAPQSPADLLNVINRGQVLFDELPVNVRANFGHSLYNFVDSFGSADFLQKLSAAYGIDTPEDNNTTSEPVVSEPVVDIGNTDTSVDSNDTNI